MNANKARRASIDSYRRAVDNIIASLGVSIAESDKESDKKARLKSKKNAFISAKNIMLLIYETEKMYFNGADMGWFKDRAELLIMSANDAVGYMCNMIKAPMPKNEAGGSELNASIDMRFEGSRDIKEMLDGIDELYNSIDKAEKGGDMFEKEEDTLGSIAEKYAKRME